MHKAEANTLKAPQRQKIESKNSRQRRVIQHICYGFMVLTFQRTIIWFKGGRQKKTIRPKRLKTGFVLPETIFQFIMDDIMV